MTKQNSAATACNNCTDVQSAILFNFTLKNDALAKASGTFAFSFSTSDSGNYTVSSVKWGSASYETLKSSSLTLKDQKATGLNFTFSLGTVAGRSLTRVEVVLNKAGGANSFTGSYSARAYLTKGSDLILSSASVSASSVTIPETGAGGGGGDTNTTDSTDDSSNSTKYSALEGGGDHNEEGAIAAISVILSVFGLAVAGALVYFYFKTKKGSPLEEVSELGASPQDRPDEILRPGVNADQIHISGGIKNP
jgi:hypothetical protein